MTTKEYLMLFSYSQLLIFIFLKDPSI